MATLTVEDLSDLVTTTLNELGESKFTEIATDYQEYTMLPRILKQERKGLRSGKGISFNVLTDDSGAAMDVGMFDTDEVNVGSVMTTGFVPWRHSTTNFAIDRREVLMNTGARQIVDLVKVRNTDAMISLANHTEARGWTAPSASTDELRAFGIPYWVVQNSSTGFNGGNPSGFSAGAAGISSSTYANWANWTADYTDITVTDLVVKWREAAVKTRFVPPVDVPDYNTGDKFAYYTNYDVISAMESALEDQNDNLGNDIASKDGKLQFRRVPVTWVPYLDSDTTDPVYGINWGVFEINFLQGNWMNKITRPSPTQRNVVNTHYDLTYNFVCRDRRRQFVVAKVP